METTAPTESFCQRVVAAASVRPEKVAMTVIEADGQETVTFGSMLAQLRSIAYRISQEGIAFGDRVALIGENHPNWAIAYLGIIYRGAVVTPMDPAATTQALAAFLKGSEAKLAFVSPASIDKFHAACEQLGSNIRAVALHPLTQPNGFGSFEEWALTPTPQEFNDAQPPARPEDLAVLIYTRAQPELQSCAADSRKYQRPKHESSGGDADQRPRGDPQPAAAISCLLTDREPLAGHDNRRSCRLPYRVEQCRN